jgi:DNA-binding NtrC family response regulator
VNLTPQPAKRLDDQFYDCAAREQRILVVEDDPDISHLLEIHLRDSAYRVDVVVMVSMASNARVNIPTS